ncbi:MAG: pentapeptide repeat-containing protein [Planctomycetaceae bacterium]|jgi:uncharacterized protein YjbI with pentapeptide repeats|nr:pentapeptide repeat-containing protein [Planctomycetaceae bacterium]
MLRKFQIVTDMFRFLCLPTLLLLATIPAIERNLTDNNHGQLFAQCFASDGDVNQISNWGESAKFENKRFVGVLFRKSCHTEHDNYQPLCYVKGVTFDGSEFFRVVLDAVAFEKCSFRNVDFRGFTGCYSLRGSSYCFTDCDFTGAWIHTDENQIGKLTDWAKGDVSYKDHYVQYDARPVTNFIEIDFNTLQKTASFKVRNLSGVQGLELDCDLSNFNLMFSTVEVAKTAKLDNTLIRGATISGITLKQLYSTYDYKQGKLIDITFRGHNFENGNFAKMNLSGTTFWSNLKNADFTDSKISWATFESDGSPACKDQNLSLDQIKSTADFKNKKLYHVGFDMVDFSNVDLSGFDLSGCVFRRCNFHNANLTDAVITDCLFSSGVTLEHVKSTWNYKSNYMRKIRYLPAEIQKVLNAEKQTAKN